MLRPRRKTQGNASDVYLNVDPSRNGCHPNSVKPREMEAQTDLNSLKGRGGSSAGEFCWLKGVPEFFEELLVQFNEELVCCPDGLVDALIGA